MTKPGAIQKLVHGTVILSSRVAIRQGQFITNPLSQWHLSSNLLVRRSRFRPYH